MKKILLFAVAMMAGGIAHAASADSIGVLESSITVNTVAISSFTPTMLTTATTYMPNRTSLVLQNQDTTNNIYCSEKSTISGTTNAFIVPAGYGMVSLNIRPYGVLGAIRLYCITANTSGTSTLTVIQAY